MTPHDTRLRMDRLRTLADRLEHSATLVRNGDNTAAGEKSAIALTREAAAVRWALVQIDPLVETPRQLFEKLANAQ
jgi:hypothetical protein